ncbi:Indole-3-glycerol phosphate synthase [Conexivisphaera calida]|uniref:Indole-3-glycerol phosphate synthase n=2 Tax=Conexivisphaera calida TaxID=1874277 RepID=A0A4P2VCH3_9ARCH|nr:Indole-3-glycerol phosphate synthase [Conexivisphaera calida]
MVDLIPESWYNVVPDLPEPLPPPMDPPGRDSSSIGLLNEIMPRAVLEHQFTVERWVRIPDEVRGAYANFGRPTPLLRAKKLEERIGTRPPRGFADAIRAARSRGVNPVIAELKLASPSGFRAGDVDVERYLRTVARGAAALSVITEPVAFGGSYDLLRMASSSVDLPVLMKDFVVTSGQVRSAHSLGADAVLLIVRLLRDAELELLYSEATSMGMDVLVEVHDEHDLERALRLRPRVIGVNSRDLLTLRMDGELQRRILGMIPGGIVRVAESGIRSADDLRRLRDSGADAFLVGTSLMENPGLLEELLDA